MTDSSSPQPIPVPTPTPHYYNLPNYPANTYHLLSNLADVIDATHTKLTTHVAKLDDISRSTGNAVGEVVSNSKGQATDALANLWSDSQIDLSNAHDPLLDLTTSTRGIGPGPYDFRSTLYENKIAIQTGLHSLAQLQHQQSSPTIAPVSLQQLEQWKQDVDTLDSAIANVNMAVMLLAMAISQLNNGFFAFCVTGLTPGGTLPLFNTNAFAHQANGTPGSGSSPGDEQRLRTSLGNAGVTGDAANLIMLDAQGAGLDFNVISDLLDKGISSDTIKVLLADGNPELESLLTEKSQQNFDDFQAGKITQRQYNTKMQSVNEIVTSIYSDPEYVRSMADHHISVADMYNAIDDSNVDFRMTPANAITALTGPEGTARVEVAGPTGTGGDVKFYDDKGNLILTRENKALTTTSRGGFNKEVSYAVGEMDLPSGQAGEVFIQMPPDKNPGEIISWVKRYMGTRIQAGEADKYRNISIKIVDPSGNIIYTNKMIP